MILKQQNEADKHIVVGSLEVLGSIDSGETRVIQNKIIQLQTTLEKVNFAQENYWTGIAEDNIITPSEKASLKTQWEILSQTYNALMQAAHEKGISTTVEAVNLKSNYEELEEYLLGTLKVFDDMTKKTVIPDTDIYEQTFDTYYEAQITLQTVLYATTSIIRTITNLSQTGTEGEVVLYKNRFVKWIDGAWQFFDVSEYDGCLDELPPDIYNHYFLCKENFTQDVALKLNNKLFVNEDEKIVLFKSKAFTAGTIYLYTQTKGWRPVEDKNDWRYTVALNDLIEYGFVVSPNFTEFLGDTIDGQIISDASHNPNLGNLTDLPQTYRNGDYFLFTATNKTSTYTDPDGVERTISLEKAFIYKFNSPTWTKLLPDDPANADLYMGALNSILTTMADSAATGYFSTIFANALFANTAVIKALMTKTLTIQTGGSIQSANYGSTTTNFPIIGPVTTYHGFKIDTDGTARFFGNTYIGGNAHVKGTINATAGTFQNCTIDDTCEVGGLVSCKGLNIDGFTAGDSFTVAILDTATQEMKWISAGHGTIRIRSLYTSPTPTVYKDGTEIGRLLDNNPYIDVNVNVNTIITCSVNSGGRPLLTNFGIKITVNEENNLLKFLSPITG